MSRVGPLASPGFWLRRAALDWQSELERRLQDLGLTPAQFSALAGTSWLGRGEQPISQQAVADFTSTDRATTSRLLRALETRGLVERMPNARSGREVLVRTTKRGSELVQEATARARAVDADFFAGASIGRDLVELFEGLTVNRRVES